MMRDASGIILARGSEQVSLIHRRWVLNTRRRKGLMVFNIFAVLMSRIATRRRLLALPAPRAPTLRA